MPSELERLDEILSTQYKQNEYISRDGLRQAIRAARDSAGPATEQYPLMMYLDGNREQYITVADAEKEAEAAGQGYTREAAPPYAEGYPQQWVERDPSRGSDWRRVIVRNAKEENLFLRSPRPTNGSVTMDASWPEGLAVSMK